MSKLQNLDSFIKRLSEEFPQIAHELSDEDYLGLVSLQVGVFRRYTQDAIDRNDWKVVSGIFNFVDENINKVEYKIENALSISFLGKLDISSSSKANKLLPLRLKNMISDLREYESSPPKNGKLNKFLDGLK